MTTDIHTHAFHPKIASKAVAHLNEYYQVDCEGTGTIDDLLARAHSAGIARCVVLCAATEPAQVIPANRYAVRIQREYPNVLAFGTIHPGFDAWEAQLDWLKAAGIRGIKLHPEFQHFWLNDPRLLPIFEHAQDDFIFLLHVGDRMPPERNPSCPYKVAALLTHFPRLRVVAAHFGAYQQWEHALHALAKKNVWVDTSSTTPFVNAALLRTLLAGFPRERLLFGSDYPLYDPEREYARLQTMGSLSDAAMHELLTNADALFGSPILAAAGESV